MFEGLRNIPMLPPKLLLLIPHISCAEAVMFNRSKQKLIRNFIQSKIEFMPRIHESVMN